MKEWFHDVEVWRRLRRCRVPDNVLQEDFNGRKERVEQYPMCVSQFELSISQQSGHACLPYACVVTWWRNLNQTNRPPRLNNTAIFCRHGGSR